MEHEEQGHSPASHGPSEDEAPPNDSISGYEATHEITNDNNSGKDSSPEAKAVELYCDALLSRAHFLLYRSIRQDAGSRTDFFSQGKAILEEAESYLTSGRERSHRIIAKCMYIRGFLFDVSRDGDNAMRWFKEATQFDQKYLKFKRVWWYMQREETHDELFDTWSEEARSQGGNTAYVLGDVDSRGGSVRPGSSASVNHIRSPQGRKARPARKSTESKSSSFRHHTRPESIASSPRPSTPSWVRRSSREIEADLILQEIRDKPSKAKKPVSEETQKALMAHENSPKRDAFIQVLEEAEARKAAVQQAMFDRCKEKVQQKSASYYTNPLRQETLLTDTPTPEETQEISAARYRHPPRQETIPTEKNITEQEEEAGFVPANRTAALDTSVMADSPQIRRLSLSPTSSVPSPGPSSPLRKSSIPGDVEEASDESSD